MITSSDLFAMAMESPTAFFHIRELCEMTHTEYPPKLNVDTSKRDALPDPFNSALQADYLQQPDGLARSLANRT